MPVTSDKATVMAFITGAVAASSAYSSVISNPQAILGVRESAGGRNAAALSVHDDGGWSSWQVCTPILIHHVVEVGNGS